MQIIFSRTLFHFADLGFIYRWFKFMKINKKIIILCFLFSVSFSCPALNSFLFFLYRLYVLLVFIFLFQALTGFTLRILRFVRFVRFFLFIRPLIIHQFLLFRFIRFIWSLWHILRLNFTLFHFFFYFLLLNYQSSLDKKVLSSVCLRSQIRHFALKKRRAFHFKTLCVNKLSGIGV